MITFDQVLPKVHEILKPHSDTISRIQPVIVNRDLNGRVRLIIRETMKGNSVAMAAIKTIAAELAEQLKPHSFPAGQVVLFEDDDMESLLAAAPTFPLEDIEGVYVMDRLANESRWASIAPLSLGVPRAVFFSIKGGVGRSTAMAVLAWSLAQAGKRVLVLDLDLESPGLSSALLPAERQPAYGIADWLVEDLVDNGDAVFEDMIAISTLSHDGEIDVVPAHGRNPGEYISKLGRVWMPKIDSDGKRESWSQRLGRLLNKLEEHLQPDVILIDSRSGIDEVASSCVTDLGASLVLLFAIDGGQTWSGYQMLFGHWHQAGVAREIRERLQLVGAMIPETDAADYFSSLCEKSWDMFSNSLYDEVPPGVPMGELFNFDNSDETAPHFPWPIRWHRGFAALSSLHSHLETIDEVQVETVFGSFIKSYALCGGRIS
ncbi:MAG: CobQ/CobB/MinD/ParA nucleotide binding domain-containing protein [Candidatus Electronema aureum]|uniref:CobQ/CobB/MinD/ParA nucleotide binding domain-containing protein n=1 Tax=Candidatus Electronema aureum TaxID=2005002 RepID=A0A521G0C7_9BACT|nr:MAG: CobQ/CobB/MinD/ParA nucleotide binding domain-containing protein [Candidatus Electronema aureum]